MDDEQFTKKQLTNIWPESPKRIDYAFDLIHDFCLSYKMALAWETQWSIVNLACNLASIKSTDLFVELAEIFKTISLNKNG